MKIKPSSNPDYHPIMQANPCVSSNAPPRLLQMENRVTTVRYCFLARGSQREGCIDPDAGISPCANRMGKHAFQAHFDGKYISKNIYARWLTDTDTHRQAHTHTHVDNDNTQGQNWPWEKWYIVFRYTGRENYLDIPIPRYKVEYGGRSVIVAGARHWNRSK